MDSVPDGNNNKRITRQNTDFAPFMDRQNPQYSLKDAKQGIERRNYNGPNYDDATGTRI